MQPEREIFAVEISNMRLDADWMRPSWTERNPSLFAAVEAARAVCTEGSLLSHHHQPNCVLKACTGSCQHCLNLSTAAKA